MKYVFFVLLICTLVQPTLYAQPCPEGRIFIDHESGYNNYIDRFKNCEIINGGVYFSGPQLADVDLFKNVRVIRGNLWIGGSILDLDGLAQLDSIYGDLIISTERLSTITVFENLKYLGGKLILRSATNLETFSSPAAIDSITEIEILNCKQLQEVRGLEHITFIGDKATNTPGKITVKDAPSLSSIEFPNLAHLASIELNNVGFTTLESLHSIESINEIYIRGNEQLSSLEGLEAIDAEAVHYLQLSENTLLSNCTTSWICNILDHAELILFDNGADCNQSYKINSACGNTNCSPTDVIFFTQADVDEFPSLYPNCREINGSLTLAMNSSIQNIDSLYQIQKVNGSIDIRRNYNLENTRGLRNLEEVSGDFFFSQNGILNLDFAKLEYIGGDALIQVDVDTLATNFPVREIGGNLAISSSELLSLNGLDSLKSVGSELVFSDLPNLMSLSGLSHIKTVGSNLTLSGLMSINSLAGLESLDSIGGLTVRYCKGLTDIVGLGHLNSIGGSVMIEHNDNLISLSGLSSLIEIKGELNLRSNESLTNMNGLNSLTSLGGITLKRNPNFTIEPNFVFGLDSIPGKVLFYEQPGITDLNILTGIKSIGRLYIYDCQDLVSLNGLENLEHATHFELFSLPALAELPNVSNFSSAKSLKLRSLPKVTTLSFFQNIDVADILEILECESITENIVWSEIDSLITLRVYGSFNEEVEIMSFPSLKHVGRHLIINAFLSSTLDLSSLNSAGYIELDNIASINLSNLTSSEFLKIRNLKTEDLQLESLEEVDRYLDISRCQNLRDLNGLASIRKVGGSIVIFRNDSLRNIDALAQLDISSLQDERHERPEWGISDNPVLSSCAIESICSGIADGVPQVLIRNNGDGCNSIYEVAENCNAGSICGQDTVFLTSQDEIDMFHQTHACSSLSGTLVIEESVPSNIQNLYGLTHLKRIFGSLIIRSNMAIENLTGLDNIEFIDRSLVLESNAALTTIIALNRARRVQYFKALNPEEISLIVSNNPLLNSCSIDLICQHFKEPGRFSMISDNAVGCNSVNEIKENCDYTTACLSPMFRDQQSIDDFPYRYAGCKEIYSRLVINDYYEPTGFNKVRDLSPLTQIETVHSTVIIANSDSLKTLDGLENLTWIGEKLEITSNSNLNNIDALDSLILEPFLNNPEHSVTISSNNKLSTCNTKFICDLIDSGFTELTVEDNADGCASYEQVEANCNVSVTPIEIGEERLRCYPNPTTGQLSVDVLAGEEIQFTNIRIYNALGSIIDNRPFSSMLDLSTMPKGVYLFEFVHVSGQNSVKKITVY